MLLDDEHGSVLVVVRDELELLHLSVQDADEEVDQVDVDVVEVWLDISFEYLYDEEHPGSVLMVELELLVWLIEEE